jgi:hypothetical protein
MRMNYFFNRKREKEKERRKRERKKVTSCGL